MKKLASPLCQRMAVERFAGSAESLVVEWTLLDANEALGTGASMIAGERRAQSARMGDVEEIVEETKR